jgi:hypothetical protein
VKKWITNKTYNISEDQPRMAQGVMLEQSVQRRTKDLAEKATQVRNSVTTHTLLVAPEIVLDFHRFAFVLVPMNCSSHNYME